MIYPHSAINIGNHHHPGHGGGGNDDDWINQDLGSGNVWMFEQWDYGAEAAAGPEAAAPRNMRNKGN